VKGRARSVAHEALRRGHMEFVIVLIENGLEVESDSRYAHFNAGNFFARTDGYSILSAGGSAIPSRY